MNQRAKDGIKQFLEALSVDTEAPELEKTPSRVTELYSELFSGCRIRYKILHGEKPLAQTIKVLWQLQGFRFIPCASTIYYLSLVL